MPDTHAPTTTTTPLTKDQYRDLLFFTRDGNVPGKESNGWASFKSLVILVRSSFERCTPEELADTLTFSKQMTEQHLKAFGRIRAHHNFIILEKHENGVWSLRGPSWKKEVVRPNLKDIIVIF